MSRREELQKQWEGCLASNKDLIRYWHSVLTLERPIDYGVWFGVSFLAFLYLATRDWTLTTTFFLGVFFYFGGALVLELCGGFPYAKLLKTNYDMSESDPFVVVAKYAATAQDLFEHTVAEMSEFRKANSTLFTAQVCGASLVMAFISSFFSGFTLAFLAWLTFFTAPAIVVRRLHEVAWAKLEPVVGPHIDNARSKLAAYIPALAKKGASPTAPTTAASKKAD